MFDKSISVILPVYNEEGNIYDIIKAIFNIFPAIVNDFEVIVVDDGSTDETPNIIGRLASSGIHLKVIRHVKNKGYGAALTAGIQASEKEIIFIMDADRQFDIREITKLIPYIRDFDIVAGFRIKRRDSLYRRILGYCFRFIIKILFGIKLKDVNCGFKLYNRDILKKMALTSKGGLINVEIMALAYRNNAIIKEIGVNHYSRIFGGPKGASLKTIITAIIEIPHLMQRIRVIK